MSNYRDAAITSGVLLRKTPTWVTFTPKGCCCARVYAYVYGKVKKEYPESDGFWEPEPGKQSWVVGESG
jgi:hypothetical protein